MEEKGKDVGFVVQPKRKINYTPRTTLGMSRQMKEDLQLTAERLGVSQAELIRIGTYFLLQKDDAEIEQLYTQLYTNGTDLRYCLRNLNSIADKQSRLESMTPEEINKATFKGAAQFKIEHAIQKVMSHNDAQPEKSNKVCLTKGIIFKLTGSNRATINQYFEHHEIMIADHNQKHGLTNADNRKGKGFSFEQLLGI